MNSLFFHLCAGLVISQIKASEFSLGGQVFLIDGLGSEVSRGCDRINLSEAVEEGEDFVSYWLAFDNVFIATRPDRVLLNDMVYLLPKGAPALSIKMSGFKIDSVKAGKVTLDGMLVNDETWPDDWEEPVCVEFKRWGRMLDFEVSGPMSGSYFSTIDTEDPNQNEESKITLFMEGVIITLDNGRIFIWGRDMGRIGDRVVFDAKTRRLTMGRMIVP